MEDTNRTEHMKELTLQSGVTVILHYAEEEPSLEKRMVSILCAHITNQSLF